MIAGIRRWPKWCGGVSAWCLDVCADVRGGLPLPSGVSDGTGPVPARAASGFAAAFELRVNGRLHIVTCGNGDPDVGVGSSVPAVPARIRVTAPRAGGGSLPDFCCRR